jgi:ParB-like nuclease domain
MSKQKADLKKRPPFAFTSQDVELTDLLLDPNNYRFIDNPLYKKKIKTKYHVQSVQESTLRLLEQDKRYQLDELKKSIRTNGYVPMERIIVVPYKYKQKTFLVIEGNRRVAALKSLLRENQETVIHLDPSEVKSYSKIPCAILQAEGNDLEHVERVIMGIRHIAGPREWGAYQQAQLITELHDVEGYDFQTIGDHLGISTVEAARRFRAMRALKTMEADELYAEKADPKFYRLFHELVSVPPVRDRFGWDPTIDAFGDVSKAREFYELIAPRETGDAPKIATYVDVRKLRSVVGHAKAEASLVDPEQPFSEAIRIAELNRPVSYGLKELLDDTEQALSKVSFAEVSSMADNVLQEIDRIINLLTDFKNRRVQ